MDSVNINQGIERLAVCVSSHPLSERLVRTGASLASSLKAEWFVVYVETPDRLRFSPTHTERLMQTLRLAEKLGAKVQSISGESVPEAVTHFAAQNGISKIIIGRPRRPRWLEILNGSIVDEIIRRSGKVDVYIISDESGPVEKGLPQSWRPHGPYRRYMYGALLAVLVTLFCFPIHFFIDPTNLAMIYLLVVVASALLLGRGPSLLTSILSALAFDYFFTDPRLSFTINDTQYLLTFIALLGVSLVVSNLAGKVRDQVESSQQRESQTAALYELGRELTVSQDLPAVLDTIVSHIGLALAREVVIFLPEQKHIQVSASSHGYQWDPSEIETASWVFQNSLPAGRGTDIFPDSRTHYQPLITSQGPVGVLGVHPQLPGRYLTHQQRQLLEAYSSLAALAIERARLAEQASRAQVLSATEKLQTALLNSISHDLRTPLASITGAFSSLYEAEKGADERSDDHTNRLVMSQETKIELIETGWEEAERMNRLVGNLLDMTRLEAGALRITITEGDIEEVIGSALARMRSRLFDHTVHVNIHPEHLLVRMDPMLIEQVLVNLLDNAVKYSNPGTEIEILADLEGDHLAVKVMDCGRGIPEEDLRKIFDRFYRIQRSDNIGGTGLGLSICKGIVEAHNGQIWAENRPCGGVSVVFTLPKELKNG
jgi:two-component system, OmpR family, sensor histidine kinase KdpD